MSDQIQTAEGWDANALRHDPSDTLWTALLALQGEAIRIQKDAEATVDSKTGRGYKYKYATLAQVHGVVLPRLDHYRLLWLTMPGERWITYVLRHAPTGEKLDGMIEFPPAATPQAYGAWVSYLRRYALMAVLNLVPTESDNDGRQPAVPKLSASNREQAVKALAAMFDKDAARINMFLASIGVPTMPQDWSREDAVKISEALAARRVGIP